MRGRSACLAWPGPAVPLARPAALRPQFARFSPRLARELFVSLLVQFRRGRKTAQDLGRFGHEKYRSPVRSGALSRAARATSAIKRHGPCSLPPREPGDAQAAPFNSGCGRCRLGSFETDGLGEASNRARRRRSFSPLTLKSRVLTVWRTRVTSIDESAERG